MSLGVFSPWFSAVIQSARVVGRTQGLLSQTTAASTSLSGCSSKFMRFVSHLQDRKDDDLVNARLIQAFVRMRVHALTLRPDGAVI